MRRRYKRLQNQYQHLFAASDLFTYRPKLENHYFDLMDSLFSELQYLTKRIAKLEDEING